MAMTIGINCGHTVNGAGSGAIGIISESEHTRHVGRKVMELLRQRGANVVDCTIDYAATQAACLAAIVAEANREDLDWFVSIHFNAGGGRGVEVYTYQGQQFDDALAVCRNIEDLGFRNRGVKDGTGLYVVNKTKAKSQLIEVCFVDTASDVDQYLNITAEAIAEAVANALVPYVVEKAVPQHGWYKEEGHWTFYQGGERTRNDWYRTEAGYWYYFDAEGHLYTGWLQYKNLWYYLDENQGDDRIGKMKTGWLLYSTGKWYYLGRDGGMETGVIVVDGKAYVMDETSGEMLEGSILIKTDANGAIATVVK